MSARRVPTAHWTAWHWGARTCSAIFHVAGRRAPAHPGHPGYRLTVPSAWGPFHQTAQQAQPAVAAMVDRIRASPVVHADETGWRQNGNNGYVWTFSTPTERYFLRRGRGKAVVERWAIILRSTGQRFLRCLPPLRWP